ncbi:MAG: hypothetical protein ACR2JI_00735 [Mycobacterium sp.]
MSQSAGLSARSFLIAGVSAAMVGAAALTPVTASQPATASLPALRVVSPEVQLTAGGDVIIAAYTAIQPWVAYGFELADYALSFVPGLWWIAPAVDLAYFTAQPVVESLVYSFAYLLDGNFTAIGPTVTLGVQTAVQNFIEYAIAWIGSLVPLPPLPPFPPLPGAALSAPAAVRAVTVRAAGHVATAAAEAEAPADTPAVAETPADTPAVAEAPAEAATTATAAPRSRRDAAQVGARAPRAAAPAATAGTDAPATNKASASKSRRAA